MNLHMFLKYLSFIGACAASLLVLKMTQHQPLLPPLYPPPVSSYAFQVSASGIVEASEENIIIGSSVSGIVSKVYVSVWDQVEMGDPLFEIDDRELKASQLVAYSEWKVQQAYEYKVKQQLERLTSISDLRAISIDELKNKQDDVSIAEAQTQLAKARLDQINILLKRLIVCAPKKGTVLQCSIRAGEFVASTAESSPVIIGNLEHLQVRVSVDEENADRVHLQKSAKGFVKSIHPREIPLNFVRIEPYVIPKVSLTGLSSEKIDTRVLEVIFSFTHNPQFPVYVGQRIDVFIEIPPYNTDFSLTPSTLSLHEKL